MLVFWMAWDVAGRGCGAANRIRTCDPVITNDVLYQLSYCGGPCDAFGNGGRKRPHLISGTARFCNKNAAASGKNPFLMRFPGANRYPPRIKSGAGFCSKALCSAPPAGQKAAPAAGLARRGNRLFGEFVAWGLVIDAGIIGRADDGNDRRNA
jgi:hypothetical protein